MSSAPKAARAKNIRMMSSRPVRDWTKWCPSKAIRKAATAPSQLDPKRRRAIRPTMRIERVPSRATEKRQPKLDVGPKTHSPKAMIHLPTGGWTTMSPSVALKIAVVPWVKRGSTFSPSPFHRCSTP